MSRIKISSPAEITKFLNIPGISEIVSKRGIKLRQNKYRAVRTEYKGIMYDSKSEAAYAEWLDWQQSVGTICSWQPKPGSFHLGCAENVYRPDFKVIAPVDGVVYAREGQTQSPEQTFYDDVKGRETAKFRRDRKLWAAYGPCPLRIVTLNLRYPVGGAKIYSRPSIVGINYEIIKGKQ